MSSELEEFIGFCSRVIVFRNGSIFETFVDQQINADGILESMFGHIQNENSDKDESFKLDSFESKIDEQSNKSEHPKKNKLENDVSRYNVSKYFKKDNEKVYSVKTKNQDFSLTDEEHFNSILNSSESKNKKSKKIEPMATNDLSDSIEYSQNDSNQFEQLMELNNSKRSSRSVQIKKTEAYSASDEELFNKATNETKKEFNNIDKEQSNNAAISNSKSDPSSTHEYSEQDIQKFEKLITKDQSSKD